MRSTKWFGPTRNRGEDIADDIKEAVASAIKDGLSWADVVILWDYAKGLYNDRIIREVINTAAESSKASIIDPKRRDFSIFRDATLIKPNRRELTDATHMTCETDEQTETATLAAITQTNSAILLTRSGMSYFERGKKPLHLKRRRETCSTCRAPAIR